MALATINIPIDNDAAEIYAATSEENRKKIHLLLSFWLREFDTPTTPLSQVMNKISDKVESQGLTPELLEALLENVSMQS